MNEQEENTQAPEIEISMEQAGEVQLAIVALEEQIKALKDQALRNLAEAENVRKRAMKEVADTQKYAVSSLAKDMANVLENLYRSTEHVSEEALQNEIIKKVVEGIDITRKEFLSVLERHGVRRIAPQVGDKFDHNFHQALSQQPHADYPNESILQTVQAGYALNDRLLKPAMVVVSRA